MCSEKALQAEQAALGRHQVMQEAVYLGQLHTVGADWDAEAVGDEPGEVGHQTQCDKCDGSGTNKVLSKNKRRSCQLLTRAATLGLSLMLEQEFASEESVESILNQEKGLES